MSNKINLLNKAILHSMLEGNKLEIIKNFTEASIKILEADFGFAWWKFGNEYKLAYKSHDTPQNPTLPKKKGSNNMEIRMGKIFFDKNVKKTNYQPNLIQQLKSYIIIPVIFGENIYGSIVLCYKNPHDFTEEELSLSNLIGSATAQNITIPW